jgi:hypothetical protein
VSRAKKTSAEIDEHSTLEEVATLVCARLDADKISVVLSGGSAVSIYSENEYESYDLDFVQTGLARRVDRAMEALGFERQQRHWVHPRNPYWVEFPAGPVAIGEEIIHDFAERRSPAGMLRVLHPTECVMDRLTWYFHNADRQCLEQAIQVARKHPVDLERIERWSAAERPHGAERFQEFQRLLNASTET